MSHENLSRRRAAMISEELSNHAQKATRKPQTAPLGSPTGRPRPSDTRPSTLASCRELTHDRPSGTGNRGIPV
jgi:hypothetical protein